MTVFQSLRRRLGWQEADSEAAAQALEQQSPTQVIDLELEIPPNDPLLAYLLQTTGPVKLEGLGLDSPAVQRLRAAGVELVIPLISQGELIGLINLGQRMSEQDYSGEDRKLLQDLASQAAPALRVAQLVRQQQEEAAERERIAQELRVARIIQQTMLPQELPQLERWHVSAYYRPAREVGGDFYDFINFEDGRIGFIVADVTDKGVPAAMVMATTRSMLRAAAERLEHPGAVLERVNDVLQPEIPARMFVTCFYALLDPATGHLRYANAGHDVPYRYTGDGIEELRARGMPLGLMPGMKYEEREAILAPHEYVLLYSDGLVEAHNGAHEMFGFPRLQELLRDHPDGRTLTDFLLAELAGFTGPDWEQEDDVTLVTLQRDEGPNDDARPAGRLLQSLEIPSAQGNERKAMEQVVAALADVPLPEAKLERLKTAVAEATMNAMEHGNKYDPDKPVRLAVAADASAVRVRITDEGKGKPAGKVETPDLAAKLAGEQSPRGWGLFLIKNMVDEMDITQAEDSHTIELVVYLEGPVGEEEDDGG